MEEIIKQLSQKYNKDKRVIKVICEYPFLFAKRKIEDPNDIRPIMITYFGKFIPKHTVTLEVKNRNVNNFNRRISIAKAKKQLEN